MTCKQNTQPKCDFWNLDAIIHLIDSSGKIRNAYGNDMHSIISCTALLAVLAVCVTLCYYTASVYQTVTLL